MLGKTLSPFLEEVEILLWESDERRGGKLELTMAGFRAAVKIFVSALLDKAWELHEREGIDPQTKADIVGKMGDDIRALVKAYTNIDTHELYQDEVEDD